MEVTYSPLNNADKAANINKMKEISVLLEQKGFKIEGDRLVKIKSEAPKSDAAEAADAPKSRFSAAELRQKLGEKLYKAYQKQKNLSHVSKLWLIMKKQKLIFRLISINSAK